MCGHASRRAIILPWLLGDSSRTADPAATDPFDMSFSSLDFTGSDRSISVSLHGRSDSVCSRRIETHEIERQGGFSFPEGGLGLCPLQDRSALSDSKVRFVEAICRSCETFREDEVVHAEPGGVPIGLSGLWPHESIQDLVTRCVDERERLETQSARLIDEMSTRWDAKTLDDRGTMFRSALDILPGVARCIEEIDGRSPGAFDVSFQMSLEEVLRPYRDYFAAAIASAMEGFVLSMFAYAKDGQRQSQNQSRWVCPVTLLAIEKIILCPSTDRRLRIVQAIIEALRADSVERIRDVIRRNRTDLVLLFRHRRFDSSSKSYLDIAHSVSQWEHILCTLFHQFAFTLDWQRGDWVEGGSMVGGGVNVSWCTPSDVRAVRLRSMEYGKAIEFELFVPAAFLEFTLATSAAFAHLDGCDRRVGFDDVAIGQTEQSVAFGETHFRYSVTLRTQTARPDPDGACVPSRVSRLRHVEGAEIHVFELSVVTLKSRVGSLGKMEHIKTKTPLGKFAFPS